MKQKRQCPGSKIRSKGMGRGLGRGMGKGPIGVPGGRGLGRGMGMGPIGMGRGFGAGRGRGLGRRFGAPINLFADSDRDGVANVFDCQPRNKRKQGKVFVVNHNFGDEGPYETFVEDKEGFGSLSKMSKTATEARKRGEEFLSERNKTYS